MSWKITYRKRGNTLAIFVDGREHYEIDLDECRDSAAVLDKVVQVAKKAWAQPAMIGTLLVELDRRLNLQANYCACGIDSLPKNRTKIRNIVRRNVILRAVREEWEGKDGGDGVFRRASEIDLYEAEVARRLAAAEAPRRPRRSSPSHADVQRGIPATLTRPSHAAGAAAGRRRQP